MVCPFHKQLTVFRALQPHIRLNHWRFDNGHREVAGKASLPGIASSASIAFCGGCGHCQDYNPNPVTAAPPLLISTISPSINTPAGLMLNITATRFKRNAGVGFQSPHFVPRFQVDFGARIRSVFHPDFFL